MLKVLGTWTSTYTQQKNNLIPSPPRDIKLKIQMMNNVQFMSTLYICIADNATVSKPLKTSSINEITNDFSPHGINLNWPMYFLTHSSRMNWRFMNVIHVPKVQCVGRTWTLQGMSKCQWILVFLVQGWTSC